MSQMYLDAPGKGANIRDASAAEYRAYRGYKVYKLPKSTWPRSKIPKAKINNVHKMRSSSDRGHTSTQTPGPCSSFCSLPLRPRPGCLVPNSQANRGVVPKLGCCRGFGSFQKSGAPK